MAKMNTNLDDWETDPDFVRAMDEMDQRWGGNKRTVGSIDMNELIDEVRRNHKTMGKRDQHSSQRDYSSGLSLGDLSASPSFGSQEKISRRVITTSSESSYVKETTSGEVSDRAKVTTVDKSTAVHKSQQIPPVAPKPDLGPAFRQSSNNGSRGPQATAASTERAETKWASAAPYERVRTDPPKQFKESTMTKRIFEEEKSSSSRDNLSSQTRSPPSASANASQAFKSIQDKIDAFKREFENIESKVTKKSDLSKVIKKTTNVEKSSDNVQYVTRSNDRLESTGGSPYRPSTTSPSNNAFDRQQSSDTRPTSTSPLTKSNGAPKTSIKSLSERFESMGRETSEDFKRRMEEKRKEFFDQIKTQVRETRKGLDGFDVIDSDEEDLDRRANSMKGAQQHCSTSSSPIGGIRQYASKLSTPSLSSRPSSRLSDGSQSSLNKPKIYTKRETTQEQVISTFVKENDKVIHDETKRNVERTSSCHGSSDDEAEPSSIKFINQELRLSPLEQRTQSPVDKIKHKIPYVEASNKGAGLMARTLYDYQANEDDELTFDVDDLITNIEKLDQGWYKGTITKDGRKRVGLFPANYVKLLNDSGEY